MKIQYAPGSLCYFLRVMRLGTATAASGTGMSFAGLAGPFLEPSQHVNRLHLQSFSDHAGKRLVAGLCKADLDR